MPKPEKYVSRASLGWGASGASYANPKKGLVVHYDGSNQNLAAKDHSACIAYWKNTRKFHTGPARGWADLGYSFGACPHSYVFEGRGLYKYQAAQGTTPGNRDYYSVTLMCGPSDEITDAQVNAVRQLREWLMEPATSIAGTVKGHRDFVSTSCPGDKLYRMVRDGVFSQPAAWGGGGPDLSRPIAKPKQTPKWQTPARGPSPGPRHDFPLPKGHGFWRKTAPNWSVSGHYRRVFKGRSAREWLKEFGAQLARRGWSVGKGKTYLRKHGNDGLFGDEYEMLVRAFQRSQGLAVDGKIGPDTWNEAFHRPVT